MTTLPLACGLLGIVVALPAHAARMGFMLQVYDPSGYLTGPVTVHVVGVAGTVRDVEPLDDGQSPDVTAGDKLYSAPVPGFPDGAIEVQITDQQRTWVGAVMVPEDDDRALVRLVLDADGQATPIGEIVSTDPVPEKPSPGTTGPRPASTSPGGPTSSPPTVTGEGVDPGPGFLLWALGLSGLGLSAGATLALLGRRAGAPARINAPVGEAEPPMRVAAADVERVLGGPLREHRVILLGPPRPGTLVCEESAPLPDELVAAVERVATIPGAPVALLVTDPTRLDPPHAGDPLRALARRVGGRFPLWVVGGPASWPLWRG